MAFSAPWKGRHVDPSPDVEDRSFVPVWNQTTIHFSSTPYWSHRVLHSRLLVGLAGSSVIEQIVLTTDHYMIPAWNVKHARAQDFVVSDGLLRPIHKHSHSALLHYMLLEINDVWSQCALLQTSIAPARASRNPHRPRHALLPPISWSVVGSRCRWQMERTVFTP